MEGAIDLNRCYGWKSQRLVSRASFWLDIFVFIATSFEPLHSSLSLKFEFAHNRAEWKG